MNYLREELTGRKCINCGKPLSGRPDKLFCCQNCKNEYHNRISGVQKRRRDRVFAILWKNYKILESLADSDIREAGLPALAENGYNADYVTGCRKLRNGRTDYSCFDIVFNKTEARLYNIRRASESI